MTTKSLKPRAPKARSKLKRPRYVELWERICSIEEKLHAQESSNELILRRFATTIRPLEEAVTDQLCGLTQQLMLHFNASDSDANRSLLGFWIIDNFKTLAAHPFADSTKTEALYDAWRLPLQGTDDMVEAQLALLMAGRDDLPGTQQKRANYPDADMFAAADGDFHSNPTDTAGVHEPTGNTAQQPPHRESEPGHAAKPKRRNKSTPNIEQTSPQAPLQANLGELFDVHKLFRRIANAVHPDRESNEARKAEKHELMSRCLQARDDGDIAQLLSMYVEFVGELPATWSEESTGELVTALEAQLNKLEQRNLSLHTHDPILQLILDRYLGYDTNDIERRISLHRDRLNDKIQALIAKATAIATNQGLAEALLERRDIEMDKLVLADLTSGES